MNRLKTFFKLVHYYATMNARRFGVPMEENASRFYMLEEMIEDKDLPDINVKNEFLSHLKADKTPNREASQKLIIQIEKHRQDLYLDICRIMNVDVEAVVAAQIAAQSGTV